MKFRIARHTTDIDAIEQFYVEFLGLERLGEFQGHDGYDGIFIGLPDHDWHLEFTVSDHAPDHKPDDDDLLVFYSRNTVEHQAILERAKNKGGKPVSSRNPYWEKKGQTFQDPDGFKVVIIQPSH